MPPPPEAITFVNEKKVNKKTTLLVKKPCTNGKATLLATPLQQFERVIHGNHSVKDPFSLGAVHGLPLRDFHVCFTSPR